MGKVKCLAHDAILLNAKFQDSQLGDSPLNLQAL